MTTTVDELACPVCGTLASFMALHPDTSLYRCVTCSHSFSEPRSMNQEEYDEAYYMVHHKRWFANPDRPLFERIARAIPRAASVLDVGCGRGDFLRYLVEARTDLILAGVDLSKNEAPAANIKFYQGDFFETKFDRKFDVLVSLQVIEHLADIRAFANRLNALVAPGGLVIVSTVNEASILYSLAKSGNHVGVPLAFNRLYSSHHLHHFTRKSLRQLLQASGLSVKAEFTHNAPLAAIDIPATAPGVDAVLRSGMWVVCKIGEWTDRAYLQTIICVKPQ